MVMPLLPPPTQLVQAVVCRDGVPLLPPGASFDNRRICPDQTMVPSLWLDQSLAPEKLISRWLTILPDGDRPGQIELVVDAQRWNQLSYLERYAVIEQFGRTAARAGYELRLFNRFSQALGSYRCLPPTAVQEPPRCRLRLEGSTRVP